MLDRIATDDEGVRDQAAMAPPPERLRAEQSDARLRSERLYGGETGSKLRSCEMVCIATEGSMAPGSIHRIGERAPAATKLRQMGVANPGLLKRWREVRWTELWVATRTGKAPHIDERRDTMPPQQAQECFHWVRRMPNSEDAQFHTCRPARGVPRCLARSGTSEDELLPCARCITA